MKLRKIIYWVLISHFFYMLTRTSQLQAKYLDSLLQCRQGYTIEIYTVL